MLNFKQLQELSDLFGPPGFEEDVVEYLKNRLKGYSPHIDRANNLVIEKAGNKSMPTVLIDAHTDECGFIINNITASGYIQVLPLGGLFAKNSLGHKIVFKNSKGKLIRGIVSTVPIHISRYQDSSKEVKFSDLFIDVGAIDRNEVTQDMGLAIGDPGVFDTLSFQQNESVFGKAMDDRAGCFILMNLAEYFLKNKCMYNLAFSFSVQEEYGLIGIMKVLERIRPDMIIAIEGTTGSDLPSLPENLTPCYPGKGPCITLADQNSILPSKIKRKIDKLKTKASWHYKRPIFGSTNAAGVQKLGIDAYAVTVSAPCRSIHSAISSVRKSDLANAFEFVKDLVLTKDLFE